MTERFIGSKDSEIITRETFDQLTHPMDAGVVLCRAFMKDRESGDQLGGCLTYGPNRSENRLMVNSLAWVALHSYQKSVSIISLEENNMSVADIRRVTEGAKALSKGVLIIDGIDILGDYETGAAEIDSSILTAAKINAVRSLSFAIRNQETPTIIGVAVKSDQEDAPENPALRAFPSDWAYTPHRVELTQSVRDNTRLLV